MLLGNLNWDCVQVLIHGIQKFKGMQILRMS